MNFIFIALSVYLAAVLESRLAATWEVAGVCPDLLALVAFAWLTSSAMRSGIVVAALIGFASDLGQSTPLGVSAAAFAFTAFCVGELQRRFRVDSLPARACVIGAATINIALLQSMAARFTGQTLLPWTTLVNRSLLTGIYTAGIAVPVLMILGWLAERNSHAVLLRE